MNDEGVTPDMACQLQLCAVASGVEHPGEAQPRAHCSVLTYRLTRRGRLVAKIELLVERGHFPPDPESVDGMLEVFGQDLQHALEARACAGRMPGTASTGPRPAPAAVPGQAAHR